ncbi:MAG TPA: MFS transporter [Candidatus Dormibacteraeota bacterium]
MTTRPSSPAERTFNPWVVLTLVCMAQFMVILDATVVNVALPSIKRGLSFSNADLQWIVNAYTLTFGGFLLLGGRAGDLFGRQRIFLAGLVIFSLSSLVNGIAQSPTMLIVGRAVQGFGGALISPAALSIITTTFEEGDRRNKALGVWSAIAASGAAFGLLIGGALTQAISWRWAFFVNVPVGAITIALAWRMVPDSRVEGDRGVDVLGALLVTGGLMSIVYALAKAASPQEGWTSPTVLLFGGIGAALLALFLVTEKRYHAPLVRLSIFRIRSLTTANLAMLLVAGGMFAMFYFAGLYVQIVLGYSPFTAGLAFLPVCFGIGIGAGMAAQAVKRLDVRVVSCGGLLIAATGFLLLQRISIDSGYVDVLLPSLVIMSVGLGLTFVPLTLVATTTVRADDAGLASGLLNTSQQVGGSLGLAILATLAVDQTNGFLQKLGHAPVAHDTFTALIQGYRVAFLAGAILLTIGAVLVAVFIRRADVASIAGAAAVSPIEDIAEGAA